MTQLRTKVLEELKLRNYSQATAHTYVEAIRRYAEYFHLSPQQLGREHIRQYQLHLIEGRKLEPKSVMVQMAALRFLYLKVLRYRTILMTLYDTGMRRANSANSAPSTSTRSA